MGSVVAVYKRAPIYAKARQLEPGDKFVWITCASTTPIAAYGEIESVDEECEKTIDGWDYAYIMLYGRFFSKKNNCWGKSNKYGISAESDVLILERRIE